MPLCQGGDGDGGALRLHTHLYRRCSTWAESSYNKNKSLRQLEVSKSEWGKDTVTTWAHDLKKMKPTQALGYSCSAVAPNKKSLTQMNVHPLNYFPS